MSSYFEIVTCFLSCCQCYDICASTDDKYKKMQDNPYTMIYDYKLNPENPRFLKNNENQIICGFCKGTISDNLVTLIGCNQCKKVIGHPYCFSKANKKCVSCEL